MAFTIKAIRNKFSEDFASWIGIDDFDTVEGKKNYFIGTRIYDRFKKIILTSEQSADALRGPMVKTPHRDFQIISGDVFEKPDITMYLILGQRLKGKGIIFNKKLGKFKYTKDKSGKFVKSNNNYEQAL